MNEPPALTRQDAALLLAERIANSSARESDEITYEMVTRIRARQRRSTDASHEHK